MKKISLLSFMLFLFISITIANTAGNFYWYRSSGEDSNTLVVNAFPSTDREVFESVLEFPNIGTNDQSFQNDWLMQLLVTPVGLKAVFATSTLDGKMGFTFEGDIEDVWVNFFEVPSLNNPDIINLKYTLEINGNIIQGEKGTWELLESKTKPKESLSYLFEQPNNPNSLKAVYIDMCNSYSGQIVINKDNNSRYRPFIYKIVDGQYSCKGFF